VESALIETSVISYFGAPESKHPATAARQSLTKLWWDKDRFRYDCYISTYVLAEITQGNPEKADKRLESVRGWPILTDNDLIGILAAKYLQAISIPEESKIDAFHLAAATVHRMDYLVSWNLKHLVNPQIQRILDAINLREGYRSPILCTPELLMED